MRQDPFRQRLALTAVGSAILFGGLATAPKWLPLLKGQRQADLEACGDGTGRIVDARPGQAGVYFLGWWEMGDPARLRCLEAWAAKYDLSLEYPTEHDN